MARTGKLGHSFGTPGAITFSEASLRRKVLDLFAGVLTPVDHRERMERFLLKESWASALRAAAYAGNDYVLLAKARIAVTQQAAMPEGTRHRARLPTL